MSAADVLPNPPWFSGYLVTHLPTGDGQVAVLNAILRAAGRQALGATLHGVVMWGLGLPLGWLLGFHLRLGVLGLWTSPFLCTVLQTCVFHCVMGCWDWKAVAQQAAEAVEVYDGEVDEAEEGRGEVLYSGNNTERESQQAQPLLQGEVSSHAGHDFDRPHHHSCARRGRLSFSGSSSFDALFGSLPNTPQARLSSSAPGINAGCWSGARSRAGLDWSGTGRSLH